MLQSLPIAHAHAHATVVLPITLPMDLVSLQL